MAQLLGNVAVGSTVYLNENGSPQPYLVVHQGLPSSMYDSSCNGTWLLRQYTFGNTSWGYDNLYKNARFKDYLNNNVLPVYDSNIQTIIKSIKIPYCYGGVGSRIYSGSNGDSCKLFLLGGYELGLTTGLSSYIPVDGAKLSYFESGDSESADSKRAVSGNDYWTRSPMKTSDQNVTYIEEEGGWAFTQYGAYKGIRPAMVMPQGLVVDDSNNVTSTQLPWPIPNVSTLTVPSLAMIGQSIPLSWTSVSVSGYDVTYQLQRNVNNGGWQNVGSATAQTSYTDMAQTGWTQVQYQVAAIVDEFAGDYTQSDVIPVSDPQALVISGQDGNLGTITSNIAYTVSSNTGNPISLTRTVNGAQVVTLTVESGFAYSIPIADLPTGTGTIQITASVEDTSQEIQTKTRTWTYYKTPINIPSTGGIAQLTQNGQNIWPVTVPDAVEAPVYLGGNLNAALNKLGQAALYTKIGSPKYNQVTVDLSKVKVGDEVLLPENGVMVPFVVISSNYEPVLNTNENKLLLMRKNGYISISWDNNNINSYKNSSVNSWLNNNYFNLLGTEVQSSISSTNFYVTEGNGNNSIITMQEKVFLLSLTEFGGNNSSANVEGSNLNIPNILKTKQWTRTSSLANLGYAFEVRSYNTYGTNPCKNSDPIRPVFTISNSFNQTYYVDSSNNIHPAQEYTTGGSITDVFGYDVPICQYETGSYVGTGVAGVNNPNSLTFSFTPKMIVIMSQTMASSNYTYTILALNGVQELNSVYLKTNNYPATVGKTIITFSGNQVSWYALGTASNSQTIDGQLNTSGQTYYYVAIG